MLDDYITDKQLIEKFGGQISKHTLQKYRTEGKLPYSKFGGAIVYKITDVVKMIEDRMIRTKSS